MRANASFKSFVPIEVALDPAEYKRRRRRTGPPIGAIGRSTSGGRSGATRRIDPGRIPTAGSCRRGPRGVAPTGDTVNGVMENRHRLLLGLGVEIFQSSTAEKTGCLALLNRAKRRRHFTPRTLRTDKGFFHENFLEALFARGIAPHVATDTRGRAAAHPRVRMRARGRGYQLAQRCRKLIEELFGEGKDWHGLRRFRRPRLRRVRQETLLIGLEPQAIGQAPRPRGAAGMSPA